MFQWQTFTSCVNSKTSPPVFMCQLRNVCVNLSMANLQTLYVLFPCVNSETFVIMCQRQTLTLCVQVSMANIHVMCSCVKDKPSHLVFLFHWQTFKLANCQWLSFTPCVHLSVANLHVMCSCVTSKTSPLVFICQ